MYKQYIMQINNVHKDDGTFNRDRTWTKDRVNAMTHCLNTLSLSTVTTYVHSVTLVQQKKRKNPIIFLILLVTILNRLIFDFKRKGLFSLNQKKDFSFASKV